MIKRQMRADMTKGESGKMSRKRLAAFFVAAVMAVMALPALPAKAYETYTITLIWKHKIVSSDIHNGFFEVEYDDDGNPFYRYGDVIISVDHGFNIYDREDVVQITDVEKSDCLTGNEFDEFDLRYFNYEVTGWSTEPDGEVVIESNQSFYHSYVSLYDGLTLYPVIWHQLPNITYYNTYTGEKYESTGGYTESVISNISLRYERPYHYLAGWAEEPGGALKYKEKDKITKSEHMDLYSVWEQSRISNIPPVGRSAEGYYEHFWFGGRYWRKIGAGNDKLLLVYDDKMTLGGNDVVHPMIAELYQLAEGFCTDWYNSFSGAEQAAVCSTNKAVDPETTMSLQGAKLFLLSRLEAYTYFAGKEDRKFSGIFINRWFLRDWLKDYGLEYHHYLIVDADGSFSSVPDLNYIYYLENHGLTYAAGERPAFVLDMTKVLFTSPATTESKSSAPTDGSSFGLFSGSDAYEHYEHWREELKMTLLDETYQDFTAHVNDSDAAVVTPGGTLEVSYVNAVTDTESVNNRFISAMLCDSDGDVIGYASMKPSASSGTWELKLPQNLKSGAGYTLKVFNEQQNGGGCSDHASPFSVISLTVFPAGSGTENDPWQIGSSGDWDTIAAAIENGFSTQGKYFTLTDNISVTSMMGTQDHKFSGVFDGGGKILNFKAANTDNSVSVAPFAWTNGATIRNLHVTGAISNNLSRAAGLIGENKDSVSQVVNCKVSLSLSGPSYIAGFCVGEGPGVHFTGCVYDGAITATDKGGGFAGWSNQNSGLQFTDCVFAPSSVSFSANSGTFCYDQYNSGTQSLTNCYYLTATGIAQGKQAYSVTAGEGVTADFGTPAAAYNVSGITAYTTGLKDGDTFYAGSGETVPLVLSCDAPEGSALLGYDADNGTLTKTNGAWTLTMPEDNVRISPTFAPAFGTPDFTLPAAITTVEEEAFMGAGMSVVLVPATCTSIGARAFKNCQSLTQIRIPAGCAICADAFDGCSLLYVYSAAGSPAETYCQEHENCVFVEE